MDSESSSSSSTSQQDNRTVLGQGAVLAQDGSYITQIDSRADNRSSTQIDSSTKIDSRSNTQIDNSVRYSLDSDVANRAIGSTSDALKNSLIFGNTAMSQGYGFANLALSAVTNAENRALDSVAQSNVLVKDAYADAKGRGAMTDKITIGALALAAIVAFAAIKNK